MRIEYTTLCKQGKRRNNEDYLLVDSHPEQNHWMGIICDGMGGHSCGEVASKTVADAITSYWTRHQNYKDDETKVKKACQNAFRIFNSQTRHVEMGTTMVMASVQDEMLTIAHIGDSRCYLFRKEEGGLFQTKDHICIQEGWELVSKCFFSDQPKVAEPDIHQEQLHEGDRIFLCSDGVYKSMSPQLLQETLIKEDSVEEITKHENVTNIEYDDLSFSRRHIADDNTEIFYFYAEKGIGQGIIGVYGNNNQTLGIWHDNPEYVGNLDECTTIGTAISKKCKSLLQKGMKTLDGTYGQIAVIDAQNGRLKAWVALEKKDNGFSDAKLLRLLY